MNFLLMPTRHMFEIKTGYNNFLTTYEKKHKKVTDKAAMPSTRRKKRNRSQM
uniref:Uncharacterized protein n=1 Tax=Rhizophora mucronata TaxID=61149 RepID=A0A2P2QEK2_RHIMU